MVLISNKKKTISNNYINKNNKYPIYFIKCLFLIIFKIVLFEYCLVNSKSDYFPKVAFRIFTKLFLNMKSNIFQILRVVLN